jgi:predicted nucleotidyltransferase
VNQPIKTTLDEIVEFLNQHGIDHCVIGGLAVSARARTRATDDVDLIIDCEPEAAVELLKPLARANFHPFFDGVERVIRESCILPVKHQVSGVTVDMSLAVGGLDHQILERADRFQVFGMEVSVATNEDLVLMKMMAGRAVDVSDVRAIVASKSDRLDWEYLVTMAAQIEEALAIDLVDAVNRLRNS